MEQRRWLPKTDYEKMKQKWEERKKEREMLVKIRDDAYSYLMNDQIPSLRKSALEDPYYQDVLNCAVQIAKDKPAFLRVLEKQ